MAAYYSNRLSYEEVAGLVERLSGERLLSDQRIEQPVVETAAVVSHEWAQESAAAGTVPPPSIDPAVDVYAAEVAEVRVFEDGISTVRRAAWSVKGSKALAVLKVVELNGRWQQLWFPETADTRAVA